MSDAVRVSWETVDGSRHSFLTSEQDVAFEEDDFPAEPSVPMDITFGDGQDPVLNVIADELERHPIAGVPHFRPASPPGWLELWVVGAWAIVLAALVSGPQPRYATKWGWFWMLGLPFGLGFLTLLAIEAPWSKNAAAKPEPLPRPQQTRTPDGDRRLTGLHGFLVLVLLPPFVLWVTIFPLLDWLGVDLYR